MQQCLEIQETNVETNLYTKIQEINVRIIYEQGNGVVAILTPTPKFLASLKGAQAADGSYATLTDEEKLIHVANKDLPTGTKYEIIADSVDLTDRTFRDAWEYTADASVEKTSADLDADDLTKYNMSENK